GRERRRPRPDLARGRRLQPRRERRPDVNGNRPGLARGRGAAGDLPGWWRQFHAGRPCRRRHAGGAEPSRRLAANPGYAALCRGQPRHHQPSADRGTLAGPGQLGGPVVRGALCQAGHLGTQVSAADGPDRRGPGAWRGAAVPLAQAAPRRGRKSLSRNVAFKLTKEVTLRSGFHTNPKRQRGTASLTLRVGHRALETVSLLDV